MERETELESAESPEDPVELFVRRAAGGQRAASRYLVESFETHEDAVGRTVALLSDPRHLVRQGAAEALLAHVDVMPEDVVPHGESVRACLGADDPPFRTTILGLLAAIAEEDPSVLEPVMDQFAEQLDRPKEFAGTGYAAKALAHYGASSPSRARLVLPLLAGALAKKPKEALARELLAALETFSQSDVGDDLRERIREAVRPLVGHPNAIVRERATRLYMDLG